MSTSSIPPAGKALQWAALLFVPALSFAVGLSFLPTPKGVEAARKSRDNDSLAEYVSKTKPSPNTPTDVVLQDQLRFLGADLPKEPLSKAGRMEIKFYFEVLKELDRNWQMFLHIDRQEKPYRIHGDHWPADGRYQTVLWQKGEFITDTHKQLVPIDAPPGTYDVWFGFYVGDTRMRFSSGDSTRHDGGNRINAGTIRVK
jgi:hypothetical protein